MPAAKSGNNIVVTGTGNTLSSITADIADTTFIEEVASQEFVMKSNVARYLYINNGGELIIGDPNDYTYQESLTFAQTTAVYNRLYVQPGGHLKMYGDSTLNLSNVNYTYNYIYGAMTILGDGTYNPKILNSYYMWHYENQNNDTYANDIWHYESMSFGGSTNANNRPLIYLSSIGKYRNHVFKDVVFDDTLTTPYYTGRGLYFEFANRGISNITFDGLDFRKMGGGYGISAAQSPECIIKNSKFGGGNTYRVQLSRSGGQQKFQGYYSYNYDSGAFFGQSFTLFDTCTFYTSSTYHRDCTISNGAMACFLSCSFEETSDYRILSSYQSVTMLWGDSNQFVDFRVGGENTGLVNVVYPLELTILDKNSNPIEEATVYIEQSDSKEKLLFHTNSSGKMRNCNNLNVALLSNKSYYGYTTGTTNVEIWSSGSNNTYHNVTVFKNGYRPYHTTYVMDQDRTDTIYLDRIDARTLTF